MEIRIPLFPQPVKDEMGMWHWRDCQWLDEGLGFPSTGIEDYCPFRRDQVVNIDNEDRKVLFIAVSMDTSGIWSWSVFIEKTPKVIKYRKHKDDYELRAAATEMATWVTIRTYENGCSRDAKRLSTPQETSAIYKIAYSALVSLNYYSASVGDDIVAKVTDVVLNTAETAIDQLIPDCNGYDTIYLPLRRFVETWPWREDEDSPVTNLPQEESAENTSLRENLENSGLSLEEIDEILENADGRYQEIIEAGGKITAVYADVEALGADNDDNGCRDENDDDESFGYFLLSVPDGGFVELSDGRIVQVEK